MTAFSIEEALVSWLRGLGYDAFSQVPATRPHRFVTIERTGGGVENLVDYPTVAIQTWGETQADAEALANEIRFRVLMGERPSGVHSMRVNSGAYKYYDPDSMQPRYQTLYDVVCQISN